MRSEDLSVTLRRRDPWEAIDLGTAMVRQWWRPLYGAWLLVYVPIAVLLLALFGPSWGTGVLWLVKPLLDRVALHVLATAVFATPPSPMQTLRALRRRLGPGVFWSLTLRRFDPARSFNLPVAQLEGQTGAAGRERRRILQRFTSSYAVWLTVAFIHFEYLLLFAGLAISDLLIPASSNEGSSFFSAVFEGRFDEASQLSWFGAVSWVFAVAILEPIYVASGFALYLNRRTLLEGWDLEVQFRRLAETLRATQFGRAAAVLLFVISGALTFALNPNNAWAQTEHPQEATTSTTTPKVETPVDETAAEINVPEGMQDEVDTAAEEPPSPPRAAASNQAGNGVSARKNEDVQAIANDILKAPEFSKTEDRKRLRYIGPHWDWNKKAKDDEPAAQPWNFGLLPSELFRLLAFLILAIALGYVAIIIFRNLRGSGGTAVKPYRPPATMFGLDVRPESLPSDIRSAALELVRKGDLRGALALLYRASLVTLIQKDHVELQSSDTEYECLNRASGKLSVPRLAFFRQLVSAWETVAYAQRPVTSEAVTELCNAWPVTFETAAT